MEGREYAPRGKRASASALVVAGHLKCLGEATASTCFIKDEQHRGHNPAKSEPNSDARKVNNTEDTESTEGHRVEIWFFPSFDQFHYLSVVLCILCILCVFRATQFKKNSLWQEENKI
jgi:hypothetical protein